MSDFTLEELAEIVAARAASGDPSSYTAKLAGRGVAACAKKLGEEAVEAAIAAVAGRPRRPEARRRRTCSTTSWCCCTSSGVSFDDVKAELAAPHGADRA